MPRAWKKIAGSVLALTVLIGVTSCASGDGSSGDANELIVYNAQHESLTQAWSDAFTKETGIKVTLRNGSDTELGNQIVAEGDRSPADVFLTENSPAMALVENAGLFADVDQTTLDQVPAKYRPSTGKWTGIAARTTVFAYNKDKLAQDQLPKSLLDLQQPEWKGRWAASPSGADFQAIVGALLVLKGEDATLEWLKGMKENFTSYKGNNTVLKAVNSGEIPGGIIYQYYWFSDQAKTGENSANTALHYFRNEDPGAFVSISGGGVLRSTKKSEAAQRFLSFITGTTGQEVLQTGQSFEYAVASDVASNPALVPLADLDAPAIDPSSLDSKKVSELMTEAGLL